MRTPRAAVLAAVICALLLAGCATESAPRGSGGPGRSPGTDPAFAAFTITKSGGIAGIRQRIDVAPDGTVREGGKIVGHLDAADRAELSTLLTGQQIRTEAGRAQPRGNTCADGFQFTLVMGDLLVSDYACGRPANKPAFNRVLELTSASHIKK